MKRRPRRDFGRVADELHGFLFRRMDQAEFDGVKRELLSRLVYVRAVALIAPQRTPQMRHLYADLMRTPCFKLNK